MCNWKHLGSFSTQKIGQAYADDPELKLELVDANTWEQDKNTPFHQGLQRAMGSASGSTVQDELRPQLDRCDFKTYRPKLFGQLRQLFGIDPSGTHGAALPEHGLLHEAMAEYKKGSFTGGASGAFMYFSGDKRFIVKQISQEEHSMLMAILDDYAKHMQDSVQWGHSEGNLQANKQVQSLLLKVVQCNRVQLFQTRAKTCPVLEKKLSVRLCESDFSSTI